MKRRQAITIAAGFSIGLAGCSGSRTRDGGVDLAIYNQAATPYSVEVELFGDGATEAEARVYDTALDIEADGQQMREDVAESNRYLVRYHVYEDNTRLTDEDHVHYIPSGDGTESLTFDIIETGELTQR